MNASAIPGTPKAPTPPVWARAWNRCRAWSSDPAAALWLAAALGWLALLAGGHHHHLLVLAGSGESAWALALAVLLVGGAWLEMIVAMMLPTTAPMVRLFATASARAPRPAASLAAFIGAYVAVWMAFALVAVAVATAIQAAAAAQRWAWIYTQPYWLLAAVLALAGAFQLSPFKDRCLSMCRDPMLFLFAHYRRGVRGAWSLGLRHGISCLGCCWALMLIMFGTGVGNVFAMLVLTAVMLAEKTTRWGRRLARPLGVALLLSAVAVALFGDAMWGWGIYAPLYRLCDVGV
jgi:predicted metal-binding membrane protein